MRTFRTASGSALGTIARDIVVGSFWFAKRVLRPNKGRILRKAAVLMKLCQADPFLRLEGLKRERGMLYWVESFEKVTKLPFERDYRRWVAALDTGEMAAIEAELNGIFDASEIETAGWIPGHDWSGTVYQPIYEKPARRNSEIAARIFGLIVFKVAMDRPDKWVTGRFELDGSAIRSRTYFRPGNPDALAD